MVRQAHPQMVTVQGGPCYDRATGKVGWDHREGSTLLPGGLRKAASRRGSLNWVLMTE